MCNVVLEYCLLVLLITKFVLVDGVKDDRNALHDLNKYLLLARKRSIDGKQCVIYIIAVYEIYSTSFIVGLQL